MMQYKDYFARVEFDAEANIFHGEVINTRDVITFQGESVGELKKPLKIPLKIIWLSALNAVKSRINPLPDVSPFAFLRINTKKSSWRWRNPEKKLIRGSPTCSRKQINCDI